MTGNVTITGNGGYQLFTRTETWLYTDYKIQIYVCFTMLLI